MRLPALLSLLMLAACVTQPPQEARDLAVAHDRHAVMQHAISVRNINARYNPKLAAVYRTWVKFETEAREMKPDGPLPAADVPAWVEHVSKTLADEKAVVDAKLARIIHNRDEELRQAHQAMKNSITANGGILAGWAEQGKVTGQMLTKLREGGLELYGLYQESEARKSAIDEARAAAAAEEHQE